VPPWRVSLLHDLEFNQIWLARSQDIFLDQAVELNDSCLLSTMKSWSIPRLLNLTSKSSKAQWKTNDTFHHLTYQSASPLWCSTMSGEKMGSSQVPPLSSRHYSVNPWHVSSEHSVKNYYTSISWSRWIPWKPQVTTPLILVVVQMVIQSERGNHKYSIKTYPPNVSSHPMVIQKEEAIIASNFWLSSRWIQDQVTTQWWSW